MKIYIIMVGGLMKTLSKRAASFHPPGPFLVSPKRESFFPTGTKVQ